LRILAATQRVALASLALESALEPQRTAALPWLSELTEALDADITELASALRQSRRAAGNRRLPAAVEAVETRDGPKLDATQQFVLQRMHAYAEGTSRLGRLVGEKRV
jgi:hypothetical protein